MKGLEGTRARVPQDAASFDGYPEPGQGACSSASGSNLGFILSRPLEADGVVCPGVQEWPSDVKPEDVQEHQILAELYAELPNKFSDAVGGVRVPAAPGSAEGGHLSLAVQAVLRQPRVRQGLVRGPHADVPARRGHRPEQLLRSSTRWPPGNPSSRLTAAHWLHGTSITRTRTAKCPWCSARSVGPCSTAATRP